MQNRINFHCYPYLEPRDLKTGGYFYQWWEKLVSDVLPDDKLDMFESFLVPPLQTLNFTDDLFDEIGRVLESANYSRQIKGTNDEGVKIFNDFLIRSGYGQYWRKDVIDRLKTDINSIVVCDVPEDGGDPYYYFVQPSNILFLEYNEDNDEIVQIYFETVVDGKKRLHAYDNEGYTVFNFENKQVGDVIVSNEHNLGYCPAKWFWDKPLQEDRNIFLRKSPFAKDLGNLDWLLFYQTAKRFADIYGPFPIMITYETDDDEFNDEDNANSSKIQKKSKINGPGSAATVPKPMDGDDMMRNPMKIMSFPIENFNYISSEIDRIQDEISKNVIGTKGDIRNDAAKNEDQIHDASESRKKKLLQYKDSINTICSWLYSTMAKMMIGGDVKVVVDYGNDFYLKTLKEMNANLEEAKKNGSNPVVISKLQNSINEYLFKGDEITMTRVQIINDLDPAPGMSASEAREMYNDGLLTIQEYDVHVNMSRFIRRLEREQGKNIENIILASGNYNNEINKIFSIFINQYSTAVEPQKENENEKEDD
jgi:hypothetical protein